MEGTIRFQGGDLLAKMELASEKVTPEDFRLRPDSAGYRAGKDKQGPRRQCGPGRPRPGLRALEKDARISTVAQGHGAEEVADIRSRRSDSTFGVVNPDV